MASIETVSIVIAAVSIVVGVIFSLQSRKQELETRQAELFMQMYDRWSSPELRVGVQRLLNLWSWKDFEDFMEKYGPEVDLEEHVKSFVAPASFYESIGVLVERGLIDVTLVDRLMHNSIKRFWEAIQPLMVEARKRQGPGTHPHFDSVEDLYNRIMKLT